jgi:S1-C subfamily serine protease
MGRRGRDLGLAGATGALVLEIPAGSALVKTGLQKNDVILSVNGAKTAEVAVLLRLFPDAGNWQTLWLVVSRNQKEIHLSLTP